MTCWSLKKELAALDSIVLVGESDGDGVYGFDDLIKKGSHRVFTSC